MSKLNKNIFTALFLFVFILLSSVFTTVSYANADIFKEGYTEFTRSTDKYFSISSSLDTSEPSDIIAAEYNSIIYSVLSNVNTDPSYKTAEFEELMQQLIDYYNTNYNTTYNGYMVIVDGSFSTVNANKYGVYLYDKSEIDILYSRSSSSSGYVLAFSFLDDSSYVYFYNNTNKSVGSYMIKDIPAGYCADFNTYLTSYRFSSDTTIKSTNTKAVLSSGKYTFYWDGTSYYQEIDDPDTPTFPTNADIASAVQKFYNSDIYKNNNKFSDFFVVYYVHNQTYAFIGHTIGDDLGQIIVPPGVREQGKLYGEQWWHFFVNENAGAPPLGTTFYLYTTSDTGESFIDDGTGKISQLIDIDFSKNAVIVYSTSDYPVRTYVLDETTGETTYTDGVIEGDQYTYDENLDPTDNYYNPLDNFVTVNPADTIVDSADFDFLKGKFEEFKDLFSFNENMQWLIIANNKLSNYFIGFIVLCAWFFAIGRILRG